MAVRINDTNDELIIDSLGGTVSAGDAVYIVEDIEYTAADLSATDLLSVDVGATHRQDFDGVPLKMVVNQSGAGVFRYNGAARIARFRSTGPTGVIKKAILDPAAATEMYLDEADCDWVLAAAGSLHVQANADVATLQLVGSAQALAVASGYPITSLVLNDRARCEVHRDITGATLYGASQLTISKKEVVPSTLSILSKQAKVVILDGGTISTLVVRGTLDLSRLTRPITFTNTTFGDAGEADVILPRNPNLITYTNAPTLEGRDPRRSV